MKPMQTAKQKKAEELIRLIKMACVACGLNLTVYDGKIGVVDQEAGKIIVVWEPQYQMEGTR